MSSENEAMVIGALFHDPTLALTLGLSSEDFESEGYAKVWALGCDAVARGSGIDVELVEKTFPGAWAGHFRALVDNTAWGTKSIFESNAGVVREAAHRRRIKALCKSLIDEADDPNFTPAELAANAVRAFSQSEPAGGLLKQQTAERVVGALQRPPPSFCTGLPTLDNAIGGGFFAGKLYGIGARKKVGKTALLGTISHNLNRVHAKHLFVALEMSPVEIEQRNMAREFGINSVQFLKPTNFMLEQRAADYATRVPNFTVYEHAPGMSLDELKSAIARAVIHHSISGVIVDYWQLVGGKPKGETEEWHLRNVAQGLADICRKQGLWCLIASQLNQEMNTRGGEGLKLACDIYFTLHREKEDDRAWLEMEESRYVLYANVGTEMTPGLKLNKHGPYFEDILAAVDAETGEWK